MVIVSSAYGYNTFVYVINLSNKYFVYNFMCHSWLEFEQMSPSEIIIIINNVFHKALTKLIYIKR